jgi:hypothetical protein
MGSIGNDHHGNDLPEAFCWTKFGPEAGEQAWSIFQRKEVERRRNGGIFLWGIGQSIRPSLPELLRLAPVPEVIFSPIRSAAASRDLFPSQVTVWCDAIGYDGRTYRLPRYSLVTSQGNSLRRSAHFALVCESAGPLSPSTTDVPFLSLRDMRNLVSGSQLGSSQVTAVVRRVRSPASGTVEYPAAMRARLVHPYLIRLTRGVMVPAALRPDGASGTEAFDSIIDRLLGLRWDNSEGRDPLREVPQSTPMQSSLLVLF